MRRSVLLALALAVGCQGAHPDEPTAPGSSVGTSVVPPPATEVPTAPGDGPWPVTAVVDGDTLKVRRPDGVVTVRAIGIDTPETVAPGRPVDCYGPEASARAHELLDGQAVRLEADPTQSETDVYGRTLAYVWLPDGRLYQEAIVREGLGREYRYRRDYQRRPVLLAAQAEAQAAGRGLWSACPRKGVVR